MELHRCKPSSRRGISADTDDTQWIDRVLYPSYLPGAVLSIHPAGATRLQLYAGGCYQGIQGQGRAYNTRGARY